MKTELYKASDRGFANHGWLQANYSFSFANYYNPKRLNFGALRVLNDDLIAPSMGFGKHPHDNMEIITIPLSGVLKHKDSMDNIWHELKVGEVQVMSAGTGVYHSEINGSSNENLSLFQIWIMPDKQNVSPRYDQKFFDDYLYDGKLKTLVSSIDSNSDDDSLKIHQSAKISRVKLSSNDTVNYKLISKQHGVYIINIYGAGQVNNTTFNSRDSIGISEANSFELKAVEDSEFLYIEVPMTF